MRGLITSIIATLNRSSTDDRPLYTPPLAGSGAPMSRGTGWCADSSDSTRAADRAPQQEWTLSRECLLEWGDDCAEPLADQPIEIAAHRLALWVEHLAGQEILASEIAAIYLEMCAELWWRPHRWEGRGGVAQHYRALAGHPKVWRWFTYPDGTRHRLYVYPITKLARGRSQLRSRQQRVTTRTPAQVFQTPSAAALAA